MVYPAIAERFRRSMEEDDVNDIFSNMLLLATVGDARGQEAVVQLKVTFKDDPNAQTAVTAYESQLKAAVTKP